MLHVLLDTNVLVDFLLRRPRFYEDARNIITLSTAADYALWMGVSQVTDIFHLATQGRIPNAALVKQELAELRKHVHVVPLGEGDVDAMLASPWPDFEDALVWRAADLLRADAIITRDKGFPTSPIPTMEPSEFFDWLERVHGISYKGLI